MKKTWLIAGAVVAIAAHYTLDIDRNLVIAITAYVVGFIVALKADDQQYELNALTSRLAEAEAEIERLKRETR